MAPGSARQTSLEPRAGAVRCPGSGCSYRTYAWPIRRCAPSPPERGPAEHGLLPRCPAGRGFRPPCLARPIVGLVAAITITDPGRVRRPAGSPAPAECLYRSLEAPLLTTTVSQAYFPLRLAKGRRGA